MDDHLSHSGSNSFKSTNAEGLRLRAPKQRELEPTGKADDGDILAWSLGKNAIVVTLDADFHAILAVSGASGPSVIRLRIQGLGASEVVKREQPAHRAPVELFPLRQLADRLHPTGDQVLGPFPGAGNRPEQRQVNSARPRVTCEHQAHLNSATPELHGTETGESNFGRRRGLLPSSDVTDSLNESRMPPRPSSTRSTSRASAAVAALPLRSLSIQP